MKRFIILGLILSFFSFTCLSKELDRFEIWGWSGEKEEFRDLYLEKVGINLAKSYACATELKRMD